MERRLAWLGLGLLLWGPVLAQTPFQASPAHRPENPIVKAEITGIPFDKYLKYKTYKITVADGTEVVGGFVHGPGHHASAMAALVLDPLNVPYAAFKSGDTRLARALRNEPYVSTNAIAGRWDKAGASAADIVLGELSEEVGGRVVAGTFRRLGEHLAPTMPFESSEADEYFLAAVEITGSPYGDGGSMEVVGLISPVFFAPERAIEEMDEGRISDSARARAMFGRAWASIGYLPHLGAWVQDCPELLAGYDTLGLGTVQDLRQQAASGLIPGPRPKENSLKAKVNTVTVDTITAPIVYGEQRMVDARIRHAVWMDGAAPATWLQGLSKDHLVYDRNLGTVAVADQGGVTAYLKPDFASQFLDLDYDRAKVAIYYIDLDRGPMVEMTPQFRPALAFGPGAMNTIRRDLRDYVVPQAVLRKESGPYLPPAGPVSISSERRTVLERLARVLPGRPRQLAFHSAASSGQSDLYYHSVACRVETPTPETRASYVPLAEALRLCRQGHGDAQSEATLLRLADHLGWIPELGMDLATVRGVIARQGREPK
jgi:hypothetical protein